MICFCRARAQPGLQAELAEAGTARIHQAGSSNQANGGLIDAVVAMLSPPVQHQRRELAVLRV